MGNWLKDYRSSKKKSEDDILRSIDDKKVEIYMINQINKMESEISVLQERIRVINLDLDAFKRSLHDERGRR